uniref:Peptidase S9 prolyl oligopeptidase catalytic domain-containing protein n=1 Tax=Solibacter usitatus (strain Ellin6076) TaxID=234267 RepID=Q01VN4_SOLUE
MRAAALLLIAASAFAQPAIKRIPGDGIAVPEADRAALAAGLAHLQASIAKLKPGPLLPDVQVFAEAVRFSLEYDEFFKPAEIGAAKKLLEAGEERAAQLAARKSPWTTATGLVVRGYVSKIDRSVQPYGLVVPPSYSADAPHRWRLDTWFHGRNETLTQVNFLGDRMKNQGEFTPRDTIVLHLYGRYCNASKFAGEVDFFEALEAVKRNYAIDENRILDRGFSMGGASVWHFAVHYPSLWAAASPGAGFAESAQYLKIKLTGDTAPPEWEQKLWHYYDAVDYAANLLNLPVIEYHGEIDPQKQAGDMMERAMAAEGLKLARLEGPQTAHKFHPETKVELARQIDAIAERGREARPRKVVFTTFTLHYNQSAWVTIDAMTRHWERARVEAEQSNATEYKATTSNVSGFTLDLQPSARAPFVMVDGQRLETHAPGAVHFRKKGAKWEIAGSSELPGLHKVHGLQGPIDDAFLDSFVFVSPTGSPIAAAAGKWVASEEKRAIAEWRRQFRGDAQVRDDKDVTEADIANSNLVLWGDPSSNRVLARIAGGLPVKWTADGVVLGGRRYAAATHAAILIFPNPLNPKKYVVLNSGFTFREADYLSNARQTPKLPDYAIVDLTVAPDGRFPGKIVEAGFFNEEWALASAPPKDR